MRCRSSSDSVGCSSTQRRNAARLAASDPAPRADTGSQYAPAAGPAAGSRTGASSSTACALVPMTPKELTPARRTPHAGSQAVSSRVTTTAEFAKSMSGLSRSLCRLGNSTWCRSDSTAFTRPTIPDALHVCPTLLFADDTAQKCLSGVTRPKAASIASISIGSPRRVAVPCASM